MTRIPQVRYKVLEFLKVFKQEHDGNNPTYAEIASHFSWASETTAWWHVDRLIQDGKLLIDNEGHIMVLGGKYISPSQEVADRLAAEHQALAPEQKLRRRKKVRTKDNVQTMYKAQKGLCWWCGEPLYGVYEIDHRQAWVKGGSDDQGNLCLSCPDCNRKKKDGSPPNGRLL